MHSAEPDYTPTTNMFYHRMPEHYRTADGELEWPLKNWLSGILDQYDDLNTLIDRFKYITPDSGGAPNDTSDLTDPMTADAEWLPWLAQHVGVRLDPSTTLEAQRQIISDVLLGTKAGTKGAIAQAASRHLVGNKFVQVYDHTNTLGAVGQGDQWDMLVVTLDSETLTNLLMLSQSIMSASDAWHTDGSLLNSVGPSTWTSSGYTASTGSTNPLLAGGYTTFSGNGNAYVSGPCKAGPTFVGRAAFRQGGVAPTGLSMKLQFLDAANSVLAESASVAITPGSTWGNVSTAPTASPAGTVSCRLRVVSTAGDYAVSNWMVGPSPLGVYIGSADPGVTTDNGAWELGPTNWAYNSSYDVDGGWNATNGTLSLTTSRFKYNNSGALLTASATDAVVNTGAVPLFEGERVKAKVYVHSLNAGTATGYRLRITATTSTGGTSVVATQDVAATNLDFVPVEVEYTATANIKSVTIDLIILGSVASSKHFIDGWLITRSTADFTYFDGDTPGCAWENPSNIAASRTIGDREGHPLLVRRSDVSDSSCIENEAPDDQAVVHYHTPDATYVTVSATDTHTSMITGYAKQAGSYIMTLQATYYNNSDTVLQRSHSFVAVGTTPVQLTHTSVAPATATRLRLDVCFYGGSKGDGFGVAQGGTRIGTETDWVAATVDPIADILAIGAKPAGVQLYHETAQSEWGNIESALPTWQDWEDAGSWQAIEESGF